MSKFLFLVTLCRKPHPNWTSCGNLTLEFVVRWPLAVGWLMFQPSIAKSISRIDNKIQLLNDYDVAMKSQIDNQILFFQEVKDKR